MLPIIRKLVGNAMEPDGRVGLRNGNQLAPKAAKWTQNAVHAATGKNVAKMVSKMCRLPHLVTETF